MGTHPIFESDFDCLTEKMENVPKNYRDLSEDHKQLYQLTKSADVNIDPTLFGHLLQFLEADVHPEAICKMLKDTVPKSPYGDEKNQEKIEKINRRRSSSDESKKKVRPGTTRRSELPSASAERLAKS